ncbi:glycoside hydrolase family 26 protein [Pedobacter sp. GR22-6]|uniref:glycoside hydrolase family 26 protein n=1 Tax=Pedobacter sp. GR22-6 TaxID=3127957 RepID=UPI00307F9299
MSTKLSLFLCLLYMLSPALRAQTVDRKASTETKNLYENLRRLSGRAVLFGHQDDMAYGVGWKYEEGRSDLKELSGEYPAVFGWDLARLERNESTNLDGVPFDKMREYIRQAYALGAVNTFSWHMDNPLNGKTAWDTTSLVTVKEMLPGGQVHKKYRDWLDQFAAFNSALKGNDGKQIPILFRPFHEHSGSWFWWGKKECTPAEYRDLWRFTIHYLRDVKQSHNLLYVFNPSDFTTEAEYLERYPGNDYVDVLSFDSYQYGPISNGEAFRNGLALKLKIQDSLAKRYHKISAIGEMGYVEIPDPNWWSEVVWKGIENHTPAFLLVWRNAGYRPQEKDNHYYAPYKGQNSAEDFLKMYRERKFLLQKGVAFLNLYAKPKH